jgi:hypothetical protein
MTSRRAQSQAAVVVLAGLLAGCASEDAAKRSSSTASASANAPGSAPTPGEAVPIDTAGVVCIQLRIGDDVATATLDDTGAAREFAAMLPVTIEMRDLFGREKPGRLPRGLSLDGAIREFGYEVGEIAYWAPGNDVAIFYAHDGQAIPQPGLVRLGAVDTGLDVIAAAGGEFEMTIERHA